MNTMIRKIAAAAALCAAFASAAHAAYDTNWYVFKGFPGEYPPGFSVVAKNFSIMARSKMDKAAPRDLQCGITPGAVYHPWNSRRKAEYITATKIQTLTAKKDFSVSRGDDPGQMSFKQGDKIELIFPGAEGEALFRYQGKQFWAGQDLFESTTEISDDYSWDEWIKTECRNGMTAYIFMGDMVSPEGEHIPGTDNWGRGGNRRAGAPCRRVTDFDPNPR